MVDCTGLENRQCRKALQGSNPCPSAENAANPGSSPHTSKGTERTGKNPKGPIRMQAGCKQDASTPAPDGIPLVLLCAWPNVPEHIRLAILSLVEPYRPQGTGNG